MSTPHMPAAGPSIRIAVVPAAGLGTRLRPLTNAIPKEMLPVGREPVLAHIAAELRGAGITDALFVISDQKPQIRAYFGDEYVSHSSGDQAIRDAAPLRCHYVVQERQLGLGDALLKAEEWTGGSPFVVAFGDCLIDAPDPSAPLRRLIAVHRERRADATVLAERIAKDRVFRYGVLSPAFPQAIDGAAAFLVNDIVEKPRPEDAPSDLVVAARWALDSSIFRYLKQIEADARGELSLTDAVRSLVQGGGSFWASVLPPGECRRDIGNFETFFASFIRAAMRDSEYGETARETAREVLAQANPPGAR